MVTQRLVKAALQGRPTPYADDALSQIAHNCTEKEDAARKVERAMSKRIAAVSMGQRIGEVFDAIVTGATDRGTFVRVVPTHSLSAPRNRRRHSPGDGFSRRADDDLRFPRRLQLL